MIPCVPAGAAVQCRDNPLSLQCICAALIVVQRVYHVFLRIYFARRAS
jgi:hypothetical protein